MEKLNVLRLIKSLTDLNSALLTGLETALIVVENWDNMPDKEKEELLSSLRLLVKNNKECFIEKPTLH